MPTRLRQEADQNVSLVFRVRHGLSVQGNTFVSSEMRDILHEEHEEELTSIFKVLYGKNIHYEYLVHACSENTLKKERNITWAQANEETML